jgi:uncharacterized protein Yka (UPF0111/DUF47 family)
MVEMVVQRWIQRLLPKDPRFVDLLLEQAMLASRVARELSAEREPPPGVTTGGGSIAGNIEALEDRAEEVRRSMIALLTDTAFTPLDRADLHELSASLHRAILSVGHAGRALLAYGLEGPSPTMRDQLHILIEATGRIQVAVGALRGVDLWICRQARQDLTTLEKRADELHQDELRRLFRSPACDARQLLRERAVLDALEEAIDSCLRAADVLERVAIKQG